MIMWFDWSNTQGWGPYLLLFLAFFLFGCSAKQRQVPGPTPKRPSVPKGSIGVASVLTDYREPLKRTLVRVLLQEGFQSVQVEGSKQGAPLKIEVLGKKIKQSIFRIGKWVPDKLSSGVRIVASPGDVLRVNEQNFRGFLEAFINPLGIAVLVNEVELEDYLRSVVPLEMSPKSFNQIESLKAQAVAARSYALAHLGRFSKMGFDVYRDERSQVYGGSDSERELSDNAVQATRGIFAEYQGKSIVAFYSSTCGGKTASYEKIFQKPPIAYLQGGVLCPDEKSPFYRWTEQLNVDQIRSRSRKLARLGELRELIPGRRTISDRLIALVWQGTHGKLVLMGNRLRFALGVRSNVIERIETVRNRQGYITDLEVEGRGFGHGVGMCQTGAVELARRGWGYDKILKHYYLDIELVQAL